MTKPAATETPTIFDVNIIGPDKIQQPPVSGNKKVIKKKKAPVVKRKPVIVKRRRRPPEKDVKPDTIFGEGIGESQKGLPDAENGRETGKTKDSDVKQEEAKHMPSIAEKEGDVRSENKASLPPGAYLFDRKTIEKYASRGSLKGRGEGRGLTFEAPEFKNRAYMRMLKDRIESIWKYPKEAARRGISGDLYIKFSIKKNGKLDEVEILRTSGYRELDEAVLEALRNADPYWPLPENYDKDVLVIKGHFIYVYGASYAL